VTVLSPAPDRAHFYPGAKTIFIKLVGDRKTGKILGAQILGPGEVAKRVNMLSMGLYHNITAGDIGKLDLAYAPPFSSVLENLITAAHIMQNKIDGFARSTTPMEVKKKLDKKEDFIFLDVRCPKEIEEMSLPYDNVVKIPLGALRARSDELPKNREIIAFCKISAYSGESCHLFR